MITFPLPSSLVIKGENVLAIAVTENMVIYEEDGEWLWIGYPLNVFEEAELLVPSDNPVVAVEQRHGWLFRQRGNLCRGYEHTSGSR